MEITLREGIRKVLFDEMGSNKDMLLIGESMHYTGSLFSKVITQDFFKTYGKDRVLDCPVAEDAIIGIAFGAALAGMTAVPEIWCADFLFCVANELNNTIAKWRYQHRYPESYSLCCARTHGFVCERAAVGRSMYSVRKPGSRTVLA